MDIGEGKRFVEVSKRALFSKTFSETFTRLIFRQKSLMISIEFLA